MRELLQSHTNPYGEILSLVVMLGVFGIAMLSMRRGWNKRRAAALIRFGNVALTDAPTREPDGTALCTGTTTAGSRAERVALPELFGRWGCQYWVTPQGMFLRRQPPTANGGDTLHLVDANGAGVTGAHAGRAVGAGRIAVVRWTLGGEDVDTGLQFRSAEEADAFVERLNGARK